MAEKKEPKGKKKHTKHAKNRKGEEYRVEGNTLTRAKKTCPKCGPGIFMAHHEKRLHCGNCEYTEFK